MSYPRYRANQITGQPFTDADKAAVVADYQCGQSFETIRRARGISFGCVTKMLEDAGVSSRPAKLYTVDETYFDVVDSHAKAYFIGFIMADGCVLWNRPRTQINKVRIAIQEEDRTVLDELVKAVAYTGPIFVRHDNSPNTWGGKRKPIATLLLSSERLVGQLTQYGLSPNKSVNHPFFSNIPDEFLPSAILGYFDGDGSVSFHAKDNNRLSASFICSIEFATKLRETLRAQGIKCSMRVRALKSGLQMGEVRLKGNRSCLRLYRYLYQGNVPSLTRKRAKFEWVLEQQKLGLIMDTNVKATEGTPPPCAVAA